MQLALVQPVHNLAVYIDTHNVQAVGGKSAGCGQADITQTKNTNFLKLHIVSYGKRNNVRIISQNPKPGFDPSW
jgi:hypothetical protein